MIRPPFRPVPVLCALLGLMTVAAIALLAGGGSGHDSRRGASNGLDAGRPEVRRALARAQAQRAALATPQARRQRERSRTAYSDLSAAEALRVGRRAHRSVLRDRVPRPLEGARRRGLSVVRFPSPYAAVLGQNKGAAGDGKPGLMAMSTMPMRSRDAEGHLRLVNLEPGRVGDAFVPDNARIKLSIGDRAGDGVKILDRGISIVPLDVDAVPGVASADAIVFANSARDSDHIVRVTPAGADSLVQLRSSSAPTRFRYRIDLPAGGALRETSTGDIAVSQNSRRVGTIIKPTGWDADQRAIPVHATLRGDVLTLDVDHRGRDVRYPAMLDPNYIDILQYRWYTPTNPNGSPSANNTTTRYWAHRTNRSDLMNGLFTDLGAGQGKSLITGTRGNQFVPGGTFAYWTFTAPGTTSVAQAEWTRMTHSEIHNGPAPCIDYGLILSDTSWHPAPTARGNQNGQPVCSTFTQVYRVTCADCNDRDGVNYEPNTKGAQFGTSVYSSSFVNQIDQVGEVTLYVVDPDDPSVSFTSQAPTGWMSTPTGTISATGSDPGLGVQSMTITNAGTVANSGCLDAGPCPGSMSRSASVSSLNLPDGNNTVNVTARDASYYSYRDANGNVVPGQHQTTASTTVKLDREAPTIDVTGALVEGLNGFVSDSASATVTARDQHSGTRSVGVMIDGVPQGSAQTCGTDGCTITRSVSITPGQLEDGEHTLEVTATDGAGNTRTSTRTFRQDTEAPTTAIGGAEWESDGELFSDDSGDVVVEADDVLDDSITPGGIRSVEVLVDGQRRAFEDKLSTCQGPGGCPAQADSTLTVDNRALGDGTHTIEVRTRDAAGNEDVQESSIELVHQTPKPPQSIDVSSVAELTIRGIGGDGTGEASATAGDVDGDGEEDYVVGSPSQGTTGAAHIVFGSSETSDVTLGSDARDASGKLRSLQLTGAQANDRAGAAVAAAGDVNGDGYMDVAVGAPGTVTVAALASGRVHVVFGGPGLRTGAAALSLGALAGKGFTVLGRSHVVSDLSLIGLDKPSTFGSQLATRRLGDFAVDGDVNGDGLDDIVIGDASQPTGLLGLNLGAGVSYVIFGKTDANTIDLNASAGDPGAGGFRIYGAALRGALGQGTAVIGDVDGDDRGDLLITAPGEQSPNGAAYVIYGREGGDVNTDSLGSNGYRIAGAAGDRLSSAASIGDVNGDSVPDLLLGGRGAMVVYGKGPVGDIDLSTTFDGYRITAPADTTPYRSAAVTGVGDQDGDDVPDAVIGFPAANGGAGEAYVVYGRPTPRPISLATMGGDEGAKLTGGGAATGASALGADDGDDGYARYAVASPGSSTVRISSAATLAAAPPPSTGRFGCQDKSEWRFFYISRARPTPRCRRGQSGALDHPLFTRRVRSVKAKAQVRCRQLGSVDCVPIAPGAGTARIPITRRLKTGTTFRLRDSYTNAFLALEQPAANCFRVSRLNGAGNPTGTPVDTNPSSTGCMDRSGNRYQFRVRIELQGRACMQPASAQSDYYLIRLVLDTGSGQGTPRRRPNPNTGRADFQDFPRLVGLDTGPPDPLRRDLVQGFVARDAIVGRRGGLRDLISARARARADDASSGCGRKPADKRLRGKGASVPLTDVPGFGRNETYQSRFALRSCSNLRSPDCSAPYSNYQGTSLAPDVIAVVANTVGVTGDSGAANPTGQTGIVRAILPRSGSFRRLDFTGLQSAAGQPLQGYVDPNVPCGRSRPATWSYGYVQSPGTGNDVNRRIYGWVAARVPSPPGPDPTSTPNMQAPPGQSPCIP